MPPWRHDALCALGHDRRFEHGLHPAPPAPRGLREKVVIYSHAWRNALLPVITVIISWFLSIFSGSVIVETTFTLNGMGQLYYQALRNSDYELALACQMFYCVVSLVGALIMDLSYGLVDPRVRVDK